MLKIRDLTLDKGFIPVQSMLKNPVSEFEKSLEKINSLKDAGCDIIRITVPDEKSLAGFKRIVEKSPIPVVADIHFDYRLAIGAIEAGADKIRINPGNIGDKLKVQKVIDCLKQHHIPVRIGINKGSLPEHLKKLHNNPIDIMLAAAKEEVAYFEEANYRQIVLSFKSSTVCETIEVNRKAKKLFDYPLHIGVTEAGDIEDGTIKNAVGIGALLYDGIGSTIRVSLTGSEEKEVAVGLKILQSLGLRSAPYEIISCPTCGRTDIDLPSIVANVKACLENKKFSKSLKIAIMGCIVNGPGEAGECDFGIAGGKEKSIVFKNGERLRMVENKDIISVLENIITEYE